MKRMTSEEIEALKRTVEATSPKPSNPKPKAKRKKPAESVWNQKVNLRLEAKKALRIAAISHVLIGCAECAAGKDCPMIAQAEAQCKAAGCTGREITSVWDYAQERARAGQ